MKFLQKVLLTLATSIILIIMIFTGLYLVRDRLQTTSKTTSQIELRKNELLKIIANNSLDSKVDENNLDTAQLKGIVASLNDPYSTYFSTTEYSDFQNSLDEKYEGIGIGFNQKAEGFVVTKVLKNSPAERSGILVNDILQKVDNQNIANLDFSVIGEKIRGKSGTSVRITVTRNTNSIDYDVVRSPIANELVNLDIKGSVATIGVSSFGNNVSAKFKEIAQKVIDNKEVSYIVLDLRSNTGGLLQESVEIASYLQKPGQTVVIEQGKNDKMTLKTTQKEISLERYPLVVVTDRFTASASEILAGSLRDNRNAKLIGQKTYGKGVVQSLFTLNNNDTLKLTIAKWLTPNGTEINKQGLNPDIKVLETEDSLKKAIEIVQSPQ